MGSAEFHPNEIVGVVDDAHLVGFGVAHPQARFDRLNKASVADGRESEFGKHLRADVRHSKYEPISRNAVWVQCTSGRQSARRCSRHPYGLSVIRPLVAKPPYRKVNVEPSSREVFS